VTEPNRELVAHRLQRARESLEDARILADAKEQAQIYNDLFERLPEGDYVDFVRFDESQVRAWLPRAEAFVEHIADTLMEGKNRGARS
jgi:uncharacterized protein (UPF0332 family)